MVSSNSGVSSTLVVVVDGMVELFVPGGMLFEESRSGVSGAILSCVRDQVLVEEGSRICG